jgi:hypothetical protein
VGNLSLNPVVEEPSPKHKSKQLSVTLNPALSLFGKQTLASSIKTRSITKNNFYMPKIANKKFVPVNKSEAKEHIFRSIQHDHETREYSKEKKVKQPSAVNSPSNFEK